MNIHYRMSDAYWNEIKKGVFEELKNRKTEWRECTPPGEKEKIDDFLNKAKKEGCADSVKIPPISQLVHVIGPLYAPRGYNNYLRTGNFKGCRPIIKPGAKFNMNVFEAINFEMI